MPYEVFADEVSKMRDANEPTADDLTPLKKLIAQYEAMDDSAGKYVGSDILAKYLALAPRDSPLKAQQPRGNDLYKRHSRPPQCFQHQ